MNNVIPIPTPLDRIAQRIADSHTRVTTSDAEWIDASIDMMAALRDGRDAFPADQEFSAWLKDSHLNFYNKNVQAALLGLASDLALARTVLTETESRSYRLIWQEHKARFPNAGKPKLTIRKSSEKSMPKRIAKTELHRQVKLGDDYARLHNTSLGSKKEMDALTELKDHFPDVAANLIERAVAGEPISAIAVHADKSFKPSPTADDLKNNFARHSHRLLSAWQRADVAARHAFIEYLMEQANG